MRALFVTTSIGALLALASPAVAASISQQDRSFAEQAAASGMAEVQTGQLALSKAATRATKTFAQTLVSDHQTANQQLLRIAQEQGFQLNERPTQADVQQMDELRQLEGHAFDKAFGSAEVKDHEQALALFEQEAQHGQDPALRAFAENTVPALRKHLEMARQVALKD